MGIITCTNINTNITPSPPSLLTNSIIQKRLVHMEETKETMVEVNTPPILRRLATQSKIIRITTILIMHHTPVPQHREFGPL
jgi:hypothetical protein